MNAVTHCLCHYCFCHGFQCLCTVLGYGKYFDEALEVIKVFVWLWLVFEFLLQYHILVSEETI